MRLLWCTTLSRSSWEAVIHIMMAKVAQAAEFRLHLSISVEVTDFAGVHGVEDWGAYRRQTRGLELRLCCT